MIGRAFVEADATTGADRFAILTYGLWNARFAADQNIVGRDARIDGQPYRVVGVLPADFELPARDIALLVPFAFAPDETTDQARGNEFSSMIARLAPGATREQLDAQRKAIVDRNLDRLPQRRVFVERSGFTGTSVSIREQLVGDVRAPLLVLQTGVVLVLLIACANVANLLLMRATGRHREVAIRTAIGAGRAQLVKQMLTEGIVLSLLGAVVGLGLGLAGVRGLVVLIGPQLPGAPAVALNWPMLAFALVMAMVAGVVFGLVPAMATMKTNVNLELRDDSARGSAARGAGATRATLVVAEVALAVMLLVGAGLMAKSYAQLQNVSPGFAADRVLTAQIVGYTPGPTEAAPHGRQEIVGGDYFRAMQIPLLKGRVFNDGDGPDSPPVVVIDQLLVDRYFQGKDPLGQQIRRGGPTSPPFTVVGVVGTINSIDLGEPVTKERLYYAVTQQPSRNMALVVKSALDPQTLVMQVRGAVRAIDPEQPMADVRTMDRWIGRSLGTRRAPTLLLTLFGAVALLLSGIGIYGVVAFGVAQRVREFGIRQALGADHRTIVRMVLGQGVRTAVIGVTLGLAGAVALSRFLESQLYGVGTRDLTVFAAAGILLLVASVVACYLPARGSTRIDPMVALRDS